MKKYFIHNGNEQQGPFDANELFEQKIQPSTMIWYEGISNWTKAEEISELQKKFVPIPPPINQTQPPPIFTPATTPHKKKSLSLKEIKRVKIFSIVSIIISIGAFISGFSLFENYGIIFIIYGILQLVYSIKVLDMMDKFVLDKNSMK